jgi:hypothetical protein
LSDVDFIELPVGIRQVHPDAFHGLSQVGFLALPAMHLTELRRHTFRELRNVSVLTIVDSSVGNVSPKAFHGIGNIHNLGIYNNTFATLTHLRIDGVGSNVQTVRIEGNDFLSIGVPGQLHVSATRVVSVENNSFPCDCRIFRVLRDHDDELFLNANLCNSPPELVGMTLRRAIGVYGVRPCPGDALLMGESTSEHDVGDDDYRHVSVAVYRPGTTSSSQYKASTSSFRAMSATSVTLLSLCLHLASILQTT